MKRFGSFIILLLFISTIVYASIRVIQVRMEKTVAPPILGTITLYTDIPSNISTLLAAEYEKATQVRVVVMPLTEKQMAAYLAKEAPLAGGDIILTSQDNLMLAEKNGRLESYLTEEGDIIDTQFKDPHMAWVGLWLNPIVFAENEEFLKKEKMPITSWEMLGRRAPYRLVVPDMAATKMATNMLLSFVEVYGVEGAMDRFYSWKPHVVQYAKFLGTTIRLVAIGEVDVGIGNYSEAKVMQQKERPLQIIFPDEGSPYYLTGVGLLKQDTVSEFTRAFYHWLLSKETIMILAENEFYYVSTNPEVESVKDMRGQELRVFPIEGKVTEEGTNTLVKEWLSKIRF